MQSRRYLEQALVRLAKVGILKGKRSRTGGYVLGRDPSLISLAEIFVAVAPTRKWAEREGASAPLNMIVADCFDRLASDRQRDMETITIKNLLDRVRKKGLMPRSAGG